MDQQVLDVLHEVARTPTAQAALSVLRDAEGWLTRREIIERTSRSPSGVWQAVRRLGEAGVASVDAPSDDDDHRLTFVALSPIVRALLGKPEPPLRYMPTTERVTRDVAAWRLLDDHPDITLDNLRIETGAVLAPDQADAAIQSLREHGVIEVQQGVVHSVYNFEYEVRLALVGRAWQLDPPAWPVSWLDIDAEVEERIRERLPAAVEAELERRADLQRADHILDKYRSWRDTVTHAEAP